MQNFMTAIEPELQRQVDEMIRAEPDARDRAMLARNRGRILDKLRDATEIANLRAQNAELEERLKPTLVHAAEDD